MLHGAALGALLWGSMWKSGFKNKHAEKFLLSEKGMLAGGSRCDVAGTTTFLRNVFTLVRTFQSVLVALG